MRLEDLQVVCISLARRPDRWARVSREAQLAGISLTRMDAVDASTFVAHQHPAITLGTAHNIYFKTRRSHYEIDAGGAIGASLSHFKAWENLLASDAPAAIVFEDDCAVPMGLKERLNKVLSVLPPDWDLVTMHRTKFNGGITGCKPMKGDEPWQLCTSLMGAHAYIVSRKGAKALMDKAYPIELHVDAYMAYMSRMGYLKMLWHPLIDIQPRPESGSNIGHGNGRICGVPTNMEDRGVVALSVPTIVGGMLIAGIAGGLICLGTAKALRIVK